jgi:hypothetical protein
MVQDAGDEFTRRCLAIVVARKLRSDDVLHCLTDLFVAHGPPDHIRSDNGPEFVARNVREWLGRIGVTTLYIEQQLVAELEVETLAVVVLPRAAWWRENSSQCYRGEGAHRAVATVLQCCEAPFLPRLSSASTRDDLAASVCSALRCAPASPDAGQ